MKSSVKKTLRVYPSPKLQSIDIGVGQKSTVVEIRANGNAIADFNVWFRATPFPEGNYYEDEPPVLGVGTSSVSLNPSGTDDLSPGPPLPDGTVTGGLTPGGSATAAFVGLPGNNITNGFVVWDTSNISSLRLEIGCAGDANDSSDYSDLTIMVASYS